VASFSNLLLPSMARAPHMVDSANMPSVECPVGQRATPMHVCYLNRFAYYFAPWVEWSLTPKNNKLDCIRQHKHLQTQQSGQDVHRMHNRLRIISSHSR
jgi:hypothetical protein